MSDQPPAPPVPYGLELNAKGKPRRQSRAGLNARHQAFVAAYISNGYNAVRAAQAAGFRCTSYSSFGAIGSTLLKNIKVKAAIQQYFRSAHMSADEIVARLEEQARANPEQFFDKRWRLRRDQLERNGHLVRKLKAPGKGRPAEIELHDAQAALIKVGMHVGLFEDKLKHVGDTGGPVRHEFTVYASPKMLAATGPKRSAVDAEAKEVAPQ